MDTATTVTQIGKYPILGILGVGGMGVVYRGMDNSVGREVAIKTLTQATEELRQRFLTEARSGILNHPNIVTIYDFGEQDGNPYIVMEFVAGSSLENLMRSGRRISMIEKLEIARQTCLGLGYAHKKGVIHRDIKPANIMVQPDGDIKIVDFGVARLKNVSGQTQTGMVIGTFHYISPERLLGKSADGRADIWSVGIVLYQLLTGNLPFPGEDFSILQRVIHEPYPPLPSAISGYPPGLDQVLDRALAKDPNERYETAEEMAADIDSINDGLKRDHVAEALRRVKELMATEQWTDVRPVLLDLQRMNPQNTEVKRLLREAQDKLSRQQKPEQLRQLLAEAEEAVNARSYATALELYDQAAGLDRGNPELVEKINRVRALKEKADKSASLLVQAQAARQRGDFGAARELIEPAIQLDERNSELRNERARIVQEAERAAKESALRQHGEAGRSQIAAGQFTEAIKSLRAALEIDPTNSEIQQLYQGAVERQEDQRRRKVIDQIAAEISEAISAGEFERALVSIQRAQDRLPGEPLLLRLKTEAENGQREQAAKKLVEKTSLDVYSLLATNPQAAVTAVQEALERMPGEPRLLALKEKADEQVRKADTGERKSQYLKRAHTAIDAKQFDEAIHILDTAAIECGETADIASLLDYARENKRKIEVGQLAANAITEARALIAVGSFQAAVSLLQPVASETGDASVQQMLRQASAGLVEQERRVDAALTRARELSAQSVEKALQLLDGQPQEVQRHSRITQLRASLDAAKASEAEATLPVAANPIQPPSDIQTPPFFAPFPTPQATPSPTPTKAKRSSSVPITIAIVVVLGLASAGAAYWKYWMKPPIPSGPMGVLELNATPFAEVVNVTGEKGKVVTLPAGDRWTPLRLEEIPAGSYEVGFRAADGSVRKQQCEVTQSEQVCSIEVKPIDDKTIEEIVGGGK
jgi:serine/threonine-protein kinase